MGGESGNGANSEWGRSRFRNLGKPYSRVPLLGWFFGALVAVTLERYAGTPLAQFLGLQKIPVLFGLSVMLKNPVLIPNVILYTLIIYGVPTAVATRLCIPLANGIAASLFRFPIPVTAVVHLALLYAILHVWAEISDYRVLVLRLTLIAVMLTMSLNVINGYMGEFSCSHPGFMAIGAYFASVFTVGLFVNDQFFGAVFLPPALGPFLFPVALILGGLVASFGALFVAIPSFRTRGDYLAIISLAFLFIVKSLIENLEFVRGPRGLSGQPDWADLPTVFLWTVLCVWSINNFVRSTIGKALNAVRDNEMAADAMTVDTRRTKMVAFLSGPSGPALRGGFSLT